MAVKKKKDEELQQSQPQRNSTYSYGRENGGNAYAYGSKGELVSTGKNVYSSTKGYNQKASFVAYDKKTSGSTKQRTSGSSWTPGGSNPTGAQKYNPATMERIKSDTTLYKKWYSGSQPTLRETVARMYQVADGDEKKFAELEGMLYQEMGSKGSVIYNPYMQATNYKAIEGLQELGIDLSGGVTSDWLAANMGLLDYGRQTTTSYGPSAPTKSSTAQQDAAYWFNTLLKAEERTQLAEAEYKSLADEVKYWADLGYSDKEIVNRVRDNFGGKYKTLNTMDEDRIMGDATLLNRAVNYSGDDTIYGMIWAARNDGGSGDYFVDSVKYTMNEGNLYKRNRDSEAARDPSSYENFDPYSYSANTHDLNQKYGVTSYDTAWLEAHRNMLADPDKAEDWRDMNNAVENYNAATVQLTALDQWLEKQVADGNDSATIEAKLAALIADGDSVWYANPDTGKREQVKLTTLQKMEDKRAEGTYLALSGAVPFTLPQYIEKAQAMVAERDAAKAQKESEEAEKPTFKERFKNFVDKADRFLASMGIKGIGSYGEPIDSALEAQENAYDANTIGKNFASSELGVEIHGDLKPYEQAAVNDMVAKVEIATQPKATQQQIDEANAAVAYLQDLLVQAANDPARQEQESYKTSEAWTSVVDALQNPREGMDVMVAEPTAFLGELESQQQPQSVEDLPQMQAYANILQGGEWNGAVVDWAFAHSNNENAIMAELVNGIIGHKTKGQPLTGIAKSWWDKFGGLVDDLGGPETYDQLDLVDMGLADYDSRTAYGTQVFGALQMNEEAYEADAITPEQYAQNLIRISDLAEGISEMTDGARATDEQADSFLENVEGARGILEKVYDVCNTGMEEQRKNLANDQRQREARNIEVLRQYTAGEGITDQGAFFDIMLTDTTEAAASDKAYQDASAFFGRTLGFDGIADDGIAFTTGDAGMDASYGKDFLLAEGASLYSKGVSALAQETLDTHMKFATACGMSLEQFYQEFPEYARTPSQIAAEARSEYHGAWGEFGMTIEGLVSANDSIMNAGADIEGAPTGEQSADTLDVSDLIALAYDKVTAIGSLNLDKTLYMMQHAFKDEESERDILLTQHGSREGVAAEWDKVIGEREQNLRNIYENDITAKQKGLTYEQWREGNTDKALDELMAKRDTAKDILDLGDPAKWSSQQAIVEKTGNIANIDKLVAENGSEFDKQVFDGVTGLMQTGQFMYQSIMLGGGYVASLAATLTSSGADAFDRFMESGDYDAALLASAGAWLLNAAVETTLDRFAPAALGGDREMRMALAKANLSKLGMFKWMKDPKTMSKMAREVITLVAGGTMNVSGEVIEESLQALVDITADNIVYGNGILPTGEQIGQVVQAGKDAVWMSIIMEGGADLVYGPAKMTDYAGNAISKAEAQLLPEHDGVILNTAIDFEATAMAIANSQEALQQIEQSSENQQLQEVTKELQEIDTELTEAETELAAAEQEQADAALALEAVDNERVENDVFTEDMSKRMVAAATNLQAAGEKVSKSRERAEAARNRKVEAQKHHDELKAKVQGMYNQVMDEAKSHYAEVVAEKYYGNDTAEQQSASNAYLEACKEMQDIKKKLAEARAEMNTYGTGTPRGEQARKNYGKRLLEADKAAEKVAMTKASMDAAYDNSPEARMENVHNAELAKAEQIATEAAEAAAADPMNVRKAQAADVEQAKLDTIRAKQEMEEARSGISQRLNSPDSKVREQAVSDWKALQQKASDAAATAAALEAEFNETDTQKNLRAAINNMKQYSNMDLMDERSENHAAASRAYAELQVAQAAAETENAWNDMLNNGAEGLNAYQDARKKYDSAIDNRNVVNYTNNGEVYNNGNEDQRVRGENVQGAPGASGIGGGSGTDLRGQSAVPGFGDRRIARWNDSGRGSSGRYADGYVKYESTTGITDVSATPEVYVQALDAAKAARPNDGHQVSAHSVEDITEHGLRPFLAGDGLAGFAVELNGNITGVFKNPESKQHRVLDDMMLTAIQEGGDRLDCYAGDLFNAEASNKQRIGPLVNKYARYGFEPVAVVKYNPAYAESDQIQDIVFFVHNGKSAAQIADEVRNGEATRYTPDDLLALKQFGPDDYEAAMEYRDSLMEQKNKARDEQRQVRISEQIMDAVNRRNANRAAGLMRRIAQNDSVTWNELIALATTQQNSVQDIIDNLVAQLIEQVDNFAQIADVLDLSDRYMWRDHRAAGRTGVTTTADRNPIEILSDLTSRIRIGYNPGGSMNEGNRRLPRAVQGFYNRHARSITTRTSAAGDLEIGLHEFGHAVQQRLPNLHANQQLLNGLSQGVRNTYDQRELDGEAIAEFVVDYIFSRDEAVRQAGAQFVQDFEDMMANDRDLYEAVMDASHQTELWNNADVGSKMDAMIKEGNDPRRGQIGNALQRLARKIETAVADLTAPADLVSRGFRRSALYSMHASRRADVSLTRFLIDPQGRNIGQSLAERFYRAGVTEGDQAEVSRYALARHALDRRRRNRDVFSEAEFPTTDLEAYIADVEANHPNIVAGADALTSFWNDFMDAWWVGTGMIDADDVATMRAMYPHYVPTFRVVGENFNQYGGSSSRFQMRRAVEGGSSLEVIDPIASIVKMTQQMTSTVTQNQLMREFHNEWRRGGLGEIADDVTQDYRVQRNDTTRLQGALDAIAATGTVDPALMDDAYAQMLNLQEGWYGTGQNYDANVVSGVDENGNRFFYKIKDRGLYNLLSGAAGRNGDMGAILNTVRNFKNAFTKLTTGSNPLFALKNMQRDIQASVNTGTHSLFYADGMYHWVRAFYEVLTGSDTYREWQAMGGGEHTRFNTELNGREAGAVVRELGRDLMRGRVTRRGNFRTRNTALENISNVLTWEQLNNAIENASRYVEYRFGRHDLSTDEGRREAFMASQDVTTNFGTHGASGTIKILNQVVPFMNATIQGLNKDVNIIRDALSGDVNRRRQAAPKAAKTLMNTALTAALQYALLKMFGSNEDDEDYELLSQEMRTGNLIIPIGKAAMEELGDVVGFDKPYIRIPIAQGPLAQGMYAKALDLVADVANYSPMEVDMWRAAKSILSDGIPDGTVFQAISDAKNNRTWYGGEIESEYMRNYSVTNRYDSDTPRAIVELGQMLNVSPAKLDYLLNQYSGFAGKIIMPLLSTGRLNGEGGLDERAKNLAYNVLKNYTIDPVSSNDLSTSYTAAKTTISQIIADGKAGKPMGDLAYSVDPDEAYSAAEYLSEEFTALDKEIAALWSEYNAIRDSDMSDGDKARQMRDIRRNYIVPLQQDAMALYEEYKMQYIDADSLALEIYGRIPGGLTRPTID